MNRRTFRYFIPFALILGLVFTAVVSAAPSAPTVAPQVCIGFQGSRTEDEPVSWVVVQGGARYNSQTNDVITADGTSIGRFAVTGQPNASYTLEIKAGDTLSFTHNATTPFPAADGGDCAIDLSSTRLQEGDADGNGIIAPSDYNRWVARFRNPTECAGDAGYDAISASVDFNEDNCVTAFDYNLWVANYSPERQSQNISNSVESEGRDAVSIGGAQANYATTDSSFEIVADLSGADLYTSVKIVMNFDQTKLRIDGFTASADYPQAGSSNIDNDAGTFSYLAGNPAGRNGNVSVVTVDFTVLDDSTPQTVEFVEGNPTGEVGTLAYDNNFNPPVPFGTYQRVNISSSTAVSMSDLGTTQHSFVVVALVAGMLGVATLVVTRTARRQD